MTAYDIRFSDWSSDVCSSDLEGLVVFQDDENEGLSQNFKLVDWRRVRAALGLCTPVAELKRLRAKEAAELERNERRFEFRSATFPTEARPIRGACCPVAR